ncbi:MAG: hypothetical protein QME96_17780, partial [Myxococcota bacterium]|nr:hypothetical protein [Myxococcota bacterium]
MDVTIPVPPDPGAQDAASGVGDAAAPPPALPEGYRFVPQIGHAAPAWAAALADGRIASIDAGGLLLVRSADLRDVLVAAHVGIAGVTAVEFAAAGEGARIAVGTAAGGVHLCRLFSPNAPPGRPAECVPVGVPLQRAVSAIASMRDGDGATAMAIGS